MRIAKAAHQLITAARLRSVLVAVSLFLLVFSIYWSGLVGNEGRAMPILDNGSGSADAAESGSKPASELELVRVDVPFPGAVRVNSVADAQARVSFEIPLPSELEGEWAPSAVWVPDTKRANASERVWIAFENGVELSVFTNFRPDFRAIAEARPTDWELVQLGQYDGLAHERGEKVIHGETLQEPSSVLWWQNGTNVTLYSSTHSSIELLEWAPSFVRAPTGDHDSEPADGEGVPVPPPPPEH